MRVEISTANLDFTNRPKETKADLEKVIRRGARVIMFQEAKRVDVDALIVDPAWGVHQSLNNDAIQGSGVAWERDSIRRGRFGFRVGTAPRGARMLTRYISWVNLRITEGGKTRKVKFVSVHLPPKRYAWLQWPMLLSLAALIKASRIPVVVGGDWNLLVNRAYMLNRLAARVGGKFWGRGIDGFLVVNKRGSRWKITKLEPISTNSDHDALNAQLTHPES